MAKKKVSQSQSQTQTKHHDDIAKPTKQDTMESEGSEKLDNLKSLNQMLLKEAFDRRHQVETLVHSKESLESELNRSNSERDKLKSELVQLGEKAAALELQKTVVDVFVAEQVSGRIVVAEAKAKGLEKELVGLKRVVGERDAEIRGLTGKLKEVEGLLGKEREASKRVRDGLKSKLELQVAEGNVLRGNLIALEAVKGKMEKEIGELRVSYNALLEEKEERDLRIESMTKEKGLVEMSLLESKELIQRLKGEFSDVVREKAGIEKEKNVEFAKRLKLEKVVSGLNEMVVSLQKEEEKLRVVVARLENKCFEGEEKWKGLEREIDRLMKEMESSEKKLEGLIDEKNVVDKDLAKALKQITEHRGQIEEMGSEKNVLVEAKDRLEREVGDLQDQVAELKGLIAKLEESVGARGEKIKSLESEVKVHKCKLEQVKVERDEMMTRLGEEKENVVKLKEKTEALEKQIKESLKAVEGLKSENSATLGQRKELEEKYNMLKKEVASLENELTMARKGFESMKSKVELADSTSEMVLKMLKGTVSFCSKEESDASNGDILGSEQRSGDEIKPFLKEFEKIKNAFSDRDTKVENMKRQLEFLQHSVVDAHKKKNFWTVLSSATTLLAAVSLAYVARGH